MTGRCPAPNLAGQFESCLSSLVQSSSSLGICTRSTVTMSRRDELMHCACRIHPTNRQTPNRPNDRHYLSMDSASRSHLDPCHSPDHPKGPSIGPPPLRYRPYSLLREIARGLPTA